MRIPVSVGAALFIGAAPAAAMDCGKAETVVETAICADQDLLAADDAMAAAYREVRTLSTSAEKKMLALSQRSFIAERETQCGTGSAPEIKSCIGERTRQRLTRLLSQPDSGPGNGSRLIPLFIVQEQGPDAYGLDIEMTRFAKPQSAGEKRFNAWIGELMQKLPLGRQKIERSDVSYSYLAFASVGYLSTDLLSARVMQESYDGGAHPAHFSSAINIGMTTGKELAVSDWFSEPMAAKLAEACYGQIAAEKKQRFEDPAYDPAQDAQLNKEVIAEHVATLSRWSITETEGSLQFDEYTVGSYAEGSFACVFPMTELKALALPGAPLP